VNIFFAYPVGDWLVFDDNFPMVQMTLSRSIIITVTISILFFFNLCYQLVLHGSSFTHVVDIWILLWFMFGESVVFEFDTVLWHGWSFIHVVELFSDSVSACVVVGAANVVTPTNTNVVAIKIAAIVKVLVLFINFRHKQNIF